MRNMVESRPLLNKNLIVIAAGLFWYFSSIMVNISWKAAFYKHPHVIDLTFIQLSIAEVISLPILFHIGVKLEEVKDCLKKGKHLYIFVIGTSFALGQLCTNASLIMVSVSLTHIIKITEPLIALIFGITILKDKIQKEAILYMFFMLIGVAIATVYDTTFYPQGMAFAGLSSIALQVRNLYIKLIQADRLQGAHIKSITLFVLSNTVALHILLVIRILQAITKRSVPSLSDLDHSCAMTGVWFAGQHIMSYFVLQHVLISTHAVLNVIKRIIIIVVCAVVLHTYVSLYQFVGIAIAFVGFYFYTITMKKDKDSQSWPDVKLPQQTNKDSQKGLSEWKTLLFLPILCGLFILSLGGPVLQSKPMYSMQDYSLIRTASVTASWSYFSGLDNSSISLIESLLRYYPQMKLTMYCGSTYCWKSLQHIEKVEIKQLQVLNLTNGTPVSKWMRRHSLMKILSGPDFENHLQKAVNLALLWKSDNLVLDLDMHVENVTSFVSRLKSLTENTCIMGTYKSPIGMCNLKRHHPFTENLIKEFTATFIVDKKTWPIKVDFGQVLHAVVRSSEVRGDLQLPADVTEDFSDLLLPVKRFSDHKKFGLIHYLKSENIGDEVQSIAAAHFLPHIDVFLARENIEGNVKENTTVILNAFWPVQSWLFGTMTNINPIPVAVHIAGYHKGMQRKLRSKKMYFTKHGPIGTRDTATLKLLQKFNIPAKFTGCLTPFLQNPFDGLPRHKTIYLVDVDKEIQHMIPLHVLGKAKVIRHKVPHSQSDGPRRYVDAYHLLENYSQAKLVITTRIHCALPCIALGTPVIFLNLRTLNDATPKKETPRVTGLTGLFHTLDEYKQSKEEIRTYLEQFDYEHPPPNPNPVYADTLREAAWSILKNVEEIRYTHKLFGLKPYGEY